MSLKVKDVVAFLESFAPEHLAEQWDNPGLLAGNPDSEVNNVMLALDVTPDVVKEAIDKKTDLLISHHPLIFKGIKSLAQTDWHNRMLTQIISNNISIYCAHTNLDIAFGGVNDMLAQKLALQDIKVLQKTGSEKLFKLVVFVPEDYSEAVMFAMTKSGAGHIGCYSDCTFQTKGMGTFRPMNGTKPFIGAEGYLERVNEVRLETVVTETIKQTVLVEMIGAHPYEEVAYDIYELKNEMNPWGIGRIGTLSKKLGAKEFALKIKEALCLDYVVYVDAGIKIKKVAVIGGAGADYAKVALAKGADALVTGDVKYHTALEAKFLGISLFDAGHQGTEWPVLEALHEKLNSWSKSKKIKIVTAKEKKVLQQI